MNIKIADLRKFKDLASHVRRQKGLEIDSYIRFGGGTISKNAYESSIQYDCAESNEDLLVNENDLYPLVGGTASEFISISKDKKGDILLTDGKIKLNTPAIQFRLFLTMPKISDGATSKLTPEFFSILKKAYPICAPDEEKAGQPWYSYVHIGNGTICSGDGTVGFCEPIEEEINMALKRDVASVISQQKFTRFSETENYHFFHADGFVMGFAKVAHIKYMDIRFAFKCEVPLSFTYDSDDLWSFNSLFIKVSKSPVCVFSKGKIEAYDIYNGDKTQSCEAEQITLEEEFPFNPGKTNLVLDALKVEAVDFYKGKDMLYLKSADTKATAIIAKIQKK